MQIQFVFLLQIHCISKCPGLCTLASSSVVARPHAEHGAVGGFHLKKDVKSVETIQRRAAQPDLLRGNTEEKMAL